MVATAVAVPLTVVLVLLVNQSGLRDDADDPDQTLSRSPTATETTPGPVTVPAPPRSAAADRYCPDFVAALPVVLDDLASRDVDSDSPYVGAWGDPPVVFRCGVERPEALSPTSELTGINGVQWLVEPRGDEVVWTAVDRPVYVELTVPARYVAAPVSGVIDAVRTMPVQPVRTD